MAEQKELWHGSREIVARPEYGKGKLHNDYGQGFYCTEHRELAMEWACAERKDGFANHYLLEMKGLSVLNLSTEPYTTLNWLAILVDNRRFALTSAVGQRGGAYLREYFLPDLSPFDIIIGWRADDSYFSFARAFLNNTISLEQLSYTMRLGELGEQVVLKSPGSFEKLHYLGYEPADGSIYYAKRRMRDETARAAYQARAAEDDLNGLYMRDILREGIRNDDRRIR